MHLLFLKMLFPSNAKVNFDEYSKLFQGDYERISLNPYTVRGKKVTKYLNFLAPMNLKHVRILICQSVRNPFVHRLFAANT